MIGLISMLLPLVLKILGLFIDAKIKKGELDAKAKESYKKFLNEIGERSTDAAKLGQSSQDQREDFENGNI